MSSNTRKVPKLRFPGFTEDWEQRKFEDIASRASSISSAKELPRVEYEDLIAGTGQLNKDIFTKKRMKSGIEFHQGDVLFGKLRPYLKNWLLPSFSGIAVGDFWVLRPQNIDSLFLYVLIQSRQFDEVSNQSTGTKMPRSDWKLVSKTGFNVPKSLQEQQSIGLHFALIDNLIALHQRKLENTKKLKQGLLQKMFPKNGEVYPEIRFPGFTDPWEQRKFEDIASRASSISSAKELPRVEYEDLIAGTGQLNKDIFTKKRMKSGIEFHQGDVLFGKLRPYLKNWLLPSFSGIAVGDFWVLRPQNIDSLFLYVLIQSRQFDEVSNQSTGTKMPRSDWKLVSKTGFNVPKSLQEQQSIGLHFALIDNLIALHQRQLDNLQTLKKALLQQMFV